MRNALMRNTGTYSTIVTSGIMLLMISGCSGSGGSPDLSPSMNDDTLPEAVLTWSECEPASLLECSTLDVPVNYSMPDGETITIAINRLPATGLQTIGSLVINPGGPGGSGIETLQQLSEEALIPEKIRNSYDIVGFDPRGVGASTPVDCDEFETEDINEYPRNAEDINEVLMQRTAVANLCSEKYGSYLTQLGSLNVVRDMESMRKALGDQQLNFLGYSYGTRLAALYLQTYPAHSGRLILDASMSPIPEIAVISEGTLESMQDNLTRMLSYCVLSKPDCNSTELETMLTTRINALQASDDPVAAQELDVLGLLVIFGVQEPEFGEIAIEPISEYLISEDPSILTEFTAFIEMVLGPDILEDSGSETIQSAVMCADDAIRPDVDYLTALLARFNATSDLFAETMIAQASLCAGWPEAVEPLSPIATDTAPMSLVIGGTTDALTPDIWGQQMTQSIGGTYLESQHLGHTVLFQDRSTCADNIATSFLVDGVLPETTVCPLEDESI
ncbi:MAG: alpha/beta fold hydrolase [Granulosicoccus sp.]